MPVGLAVFLALLAVRVAFNYSAVRHYLKLPLIERVKKPARPPSVTIVVPVFNEAADLARLLESLNRLDYPTFDVIVVDEGSHDDSAEVARRYGVGLVVLGPVPEGWQRRAFACWTGAREALGEWLLFTDARSSHTPESLQRTVGFALERGVPGVSAFIQQRVLTFWERVLLPLAYQQYFAGIAPAAVNRPADPRALASGQYLLLERAAYFRAGGHQAAAGTTEPEALARALKARGVALLAARAERLAEVRLFPDERLLWAGLAAKAAAVFRARPLPSLVGLALANLALVALIVGAVGGQPAILLAALVIYLTSVAELFIWDVLLQAPVTDAVWQPLAAIVLAVVGASGAIRRV